MRSVFAMTVAATCCSKFSRRSDDQRSPGCSTGAERSRHWRSGLGPNAWDAIAWWVTQTPSPPVNSTPSQSNVDLYPSTRLLPNPAPSAATPNAASPGQIPPGGVSQGRALSGAAREVAPTTVIRSEPTRASA